MLLQNWLKRWWLKVPSPRIYSSIYAVVYSTAVAGGIFTYLFPPYTLLGELGELSTNIMGILFTVGGLIAAVAGTRGSWRLERIAIYAIMLSLSVYLMTVVQQAYQSDGHRYTQILAIVFAMFLFIVRLAMIWRYTYRPQPQPRG